MLKHNQVEVDSLIKKIDKEREGERDVIECVFKISCANEILGVD